MEIRFFAPASLVSNLDFVETIFGNGGDPYLPENDAALDVRHWTGHTGCVILAPHLVGMRKKDLGLPHFDQATERQRRDGMCWQRRRRDLQRRRRLQDRLPRPPRRDRHHHRRQLLRLLQEGSENPDQLRRQPLRPVRRGARRRRHRLPRLRARPGFPRRPSQSIKKVAFAKTPCGCSAIGWSGKPEGYAVDRRLSRHLLRPGERRLQRPRRDWCAGRGMAATRN